MSFEHIQTAAQLIHAIRETIKCRSDVVFFGDLMHVIEQGRPNWTLLHGPAEHMLGHWDLLDWRRTYIRTLSGRVFPHGHRSIRRMKRAQR